MTKTDETRPDSAPRPLEPPPPTGEPRADALRRLLAIVDRLRDPEGGCPWDLEQTVETLAPSAIEEAFELVEAVERRAGGEAEDEDEVVEEAGDLLMLIVLVARIAEQGGRFDLARIATAVGDKLVRRHPHVFGNADVTSAPHAIANWERIKQAERASKGTDSSALAGVPRSLPALQRADRLTAKAVAAGFRWTDVSGVVAKLEEELAELHAELGDGAEPHAERLEHELGDVLLAVATLGSYTGIDPERALRAALRRFETRFRGMENELGGSLAGATLDRMLAAWERAKRAERPAP